MIIIILSAIVGLCVLVWMFWDLSESIIGKILSVFLGTPFGILLGGFVGWLIATIIGAGLVYGIGAPLERVIISEQAIYSVVDNMGIEGHFALGTGYMNDELKYYYIIEEEMGQKIDSVSADCTHIKYTDDSPKLITYRQDFKNKILSLIAFNFEKGNYYILFIPENTVKYDYKIDLE
jgi:hypothetical protein